ncbi:MAG: hypothetical protein E3K36_05885 [Candidatus Brocadia sp.]|nr:hypothetical protein [Candidatus Brocadia sp.]
MMVQCAYRRGPECRLVWLYNENANPVAYPVKIKEAAHADVAPIPFHKRIAGLVDPAKRLWKKFFKYCCACGI